VNAPKTRIFFGFLISPAIPAIVLYAWQLFVSKKWEAEWGGAVFLIIGYIVALVFGVPTYLLLCYRRIMSLGAYLFAGFVMGALAGTLIFLPDAIKNWSASHGRSILLLINGFPIMGGIAGLLAAGVFWVVAVSGGYNKHMP